MRDEPPRSKPPAVAFGSESPTRCPYCHDDVKVTATDWIACRACLARHHVECWRDRGACASCRGTAVLVAGAAPSVTPTPGPALRQAPTRRGSKLDDLLSSFAGMLGVFAALGALITFGGGRRGLAVALVVVVWLCFTASYRLANRP